jgi:anaerobic magnesium-protoporphyrin IX monomethyl ester cyclase
VALFDAVLATGEEELAATLELHRPRFFVLYEDSFNFLSKMCLGHARAAACRMAGLARAAGATVLAAGSDVTDRPHPYFTAGVQYALLGEADRTLREVLDALSGRSGQPVDGVAGLAFPGEAGGVRRTHLREPERRPDVFPFPAWDLLDVERYRTAWRGAHGRFSLNLVTTRGCPFHCNWCAKPIWGRRYAMRSPASVAEEMVLVQRTLEPDHLWFADDIFGLQPRWVEDFAREVEARGAVIPFTIQSRADLMTPEAVDGLARAGCEEVWLGAESGSQKILDAMDKGTRVEQIAAATRRLQAAGIRACWFLQFGYPGETFDDILATVALMRQLLPDDVGVSVSYPLPGTRFFDMVQAELGEQTHWRDSNDLAMMFQGTYQTPFYRRLRELVHRDLDIRRRARNSAELEGLDAEWRALERLAESSRSALPTAVHRAEEILVAPDLSRTWN